MINLIQVDKSGREIFEKDYSIVAVLNKKEIYGVNIPQNIKDTVLNEFRKGNLWKLSRNIQSERRRLAIRLHTSIVIYIIRKIFFDIGSDGNIIIEICNDFDGHFHEIKEMIYRNITKLSPSFKQEDIIMTKFQKPSLVDDAAKNIRENNSEINMYNIIKIKEEELMKLLRR